MCVRGLFRAKRQEASRNQCINAGASAHVCWCADAGCLALWRSSMASAFSFKHKHLCMCVCVWHAGGMCASVRSGALIVVW